MRVVAYIHPVRTYLPCTGVGRHINNILLNLSQRKSVSLELLYSRQWLQPDGRLDPRLPMCDLPASTFPEAENALERTWKLLDYPKVDRYLPAQLDWLYAPMDTYLPTVKCPVAITIHDIQAFETDLPWSNTRHHRWFRFKWSLWIYRALQKCRIVFAVSEYTKTRMIQLLQADPGKIVVTGNGVDLSFYAPEQKDVDVTLPPLRLPYVLVVGGLRKHKGADYVLRVAAELQRRRSPITVVVAGNSEADYETAAQQYANVRLLGVVSDVSMRQLLRGAVSLLFLSPYEGFGIPAVEAMACRTPVVAAQCGSLPEVVGDAGILVPLDATLEVADILLNLERDTALREGYAEKGAARVEYYTWQKCADRVLDALVRFA